MTLSRRATPVETARCSTQGRVAVLLRDRPDDRVRTPYRQPNKVGRVRAASADRVRGHEGELDHHSKHLTAGGLGEHRRTHLRRLRLEETRIHP